MLPNVTITPAAEKFMRRIVRFSGLPAGAGFRLVVSAGGCSGYNSEFTAEAALQPGEEALNHDGLLIFLPAESRLMLDGIIIDFADSPIKSGLTFTNPNQAPCACSSAESAAPSAPAGVTKIEIGSISRGRPAPVIAS